MSGQDLWSTIKDGLHIEERSVSISVVRVGTKQMTHSVFGQIEEVKSIVDNNCEVIMDIWGWVTFNSDKWLLCERDGKMYRCRESSTVNHINGMWNEFYATVSQQLENYLMICALNGIRWLDKLSGSSIRLRSVDVTVGDWLFNVCVSDEVRILWSIDEVRERVRTIFGENKRLTNNSLGDMSSIMCEIVELDKDMSLYYIRDVDEAMSVIDIACSKCRMSIVKMLINWIDYVSSRDYTIPPRMRSQYDISVLEGQFLDKIGCSVIGDRANDMVIEYIKDRWFARINLLSKNRSASLSAILQSGQLFIGA